MKAILAVAVLAMAAFAGVMIVGDDADAVDDSITIVDATSQALTYADGKVTGVVHKDANDEKYVITITFKADNGKYITYMDGNATKSISVTDDDGDSVYSADVELTIDKDVTAFTYTITDRDFTGLTSMAGLTTETIDFEVSFDDGSAKYITWIVGDITIGTTEIGVDIQIPVAPTKSNYVFDGWMMNDKVIITYNAGLAADDGAGGYVLIDELKKGDVDTPEEYLAGLNGNTTLKAAFSPVIYKVTFMAGTTEVGSVSAAYDTKVVEPKLPEGYKAWDFDFENTTIKADTVIYAIEADPIAPTTVYDITFRLFEGKADVIQKSDSMVIPDTTREGYLFQGWVLQSGTEYVDPVEYVKTVTENTVFVAVYKLATGSEYNVTFELYGDKDPVIQKANSMTVPDTTRAGFDFMGWVVKGSSDYVDPVEYVKTITADVTFVAVYKAVEVVKYTVTFINGDDVAAIEVIAGELVDAPEAPEGMFWLFDADAPVTTDMTVYAKPLTVTVQFAVGEKVYNAYTQVIAYGEKIDTAKLADFIFPAGYDSWNYDFNEPVTADMTVYAKAIPEPEKEPKFYETPLGQCAIVIVVFLVGLLGFGLATGRVSVPDLKSSLGKNKGAKKP